jgi:GDP-mannose 6-dehydrogenase
MLSVSVLGLGYVGSVTATCLASRGHNVIGVDVNPTKVDLLNSGRSPMVEAGLAELVADVHKSGRLRATSDINLAIAESDISFVAVATPSQRNGRLELAAVERVCQEIGAALRSKKSFHTIVTRSTVMPGTAETLVIPTLEKASGKKAGVDFAVCSNPEFLREGTAIADFSNPPFTVLGASDPKFLQPLRELYEGISGPIFETSLRSAEMVKYICNAFHALKVAFANEIGALASQLEVDPTAVMEIFKADTKLNISSTYLTPGFAFGGSCLPKDVRALTYQAKTLDLNLPLLESLLPSNEEHLERAVQSILLAGKRKIGVLGLSFKAGTDDLRESPAVQLIKRLIAEGCQVKIWDDHVSLGRLMGSNRQYIDEVIPHIGTLLCERVGEVMGFGDVIVLATKALNKADIVAQLGSDQRLIDVVRMDAKATARAAVTSA